MELEKEPVIPPEEVVMVMKQHSELGYDTKINSKLLTAQAEWYQKLWNACSAK